MSDTTITKARTPRQVRKQLEACAARIKHLTEQSGRLAEQLGNAARENIRLMAELQTVDPPRDARVAMSGGNGGNGGTRS